jgi:hypothetical protein
VAHRSESASLFLSPASSTSRYQHKRALSAPTIPPISEIPLLEGSKNLPLNIMAEMRPSPEQSRPILESNENPTRPSPIGSTINEDEEDEEPQMVCMYVPKCDTGSTLRKAISHIFGRNKLCTRSIPDHIWVHYCRKHYQRSRYRNGQEYARLQVQLVREQVQRIHSWSDKNKKKGKGDLVKDWALDLRQREKLKGKDSQSKGTKRRFDQQDGDDDFLEKHGEYGLSGGTAVPQWLREKVRTGYTTPEILEIVDEIQSEMDKGNLSQIPDIEILPNVIKPESGEGGSRPAVKRGSSITRAHRRSQSLHVGSTGRPDSTGMFGRMSQHGYGLSADYSRLHPAEKRQRIGEMDDGYGEPSPLGGYRRTSMSRSLSMGGDPYGQPQIEDRFYHPRAHAVAPSYNSFGLGGAFGGPLPAPTAQRPSISGPAMAQQLESASSASSYAMPSRPGHQRSYSELPTGSQYPSSYPPPAPNAFPSSAASTYPPFVAPTYQQAPSVTYPPSAANYASAPSPYTSAAGAPHSASSYATAFGRAPEPSPGYFTGEPSQPLYPPPPTVVPSNAPGPSYQLGGYGGSSPSRTHARHQSMSAVPRLSTMPTPTALTDSSYASGGYDSAHQTPHYDADAIPYRDFHAGGPHQHMRHSSVASIPSLPPRSMEEGSYGRRH